MKDRRGSSAAGVFPFSIACMSQSSVAVAEPQEKTNKASSSSTTTTTKNTAQSKFFTTGNMVISATSFLFCSVHIH
jgi:hypothetical protein